MTAPRPVVPGQLVFVTRRCTQRQFLLRPDDETNNAFLYCLAEAAQRFGLTIVLSQMMSNHHHTTLFDPHGREPEFREHLHKMLAKCMNAKWGRWENLWSTEETCVVKLVTIEALLKNLIYVATNPVKDGLVAEVHHWPGPNFVSALLNGRTMTAKRPRYFFAEGGDMPEAVTLELKLPDHLEGKEQLLVQLREGIAQVEQKYARIRQKTGRQIVGRARIKRQSWRDSPTSHEPRRVMRPRVAAANKWARIAALQRNKEWQADYRIARLRLQAGEPALFPYGTYKLRRIANVRVEPPPLPN